MQTIASRLVLAAIIGLIAFPARTQQPPPSLPAGTLVQVELSSDLDAKKVRAGDTFRTKVWEDVRSGNQIILQQKTIIVGHVVDAQPRTKDNPESKLILAFDKALLKDGSEVPLHGVVERVQLSSVALAAAADAKAHSYNETPFRGSTTNVAMPTASSTDEGQYDPHMPPGPTNVRDKSIDTKADASGGQTVFTSANHTDVKLRRFATLDLRIH
jgi:hypothetical protein